MPSALFSEKLWRRVNDHFRQSGQLYLDAPRPRWYSQKAREMYERFPHERAVLEQAVFLVKNLVNLQRYPDANKRTAAVLLEFFLETNGLELTSSDEEYVAFLLRVQRTVPTDWWDGRTFTLRPEFIPYQSDPYHETLRTWLSANTKKKAYVTEMPLG